MCGVGMYVVCGRTASAGGTAFSRFLAIVASRADWNGVAPDPQTRGDHGRLVLGGAHHITNPRCSGPSCQVIVRVFVGCTTAQHTMLWWGRCLLGARQGSSSSWSWPAAAAPFSSRSPCRRPGPPRSSCPSERRRPVSPRPPPCSATAEHVSQPYSCSRGSPQGLQL